MLPRSFGRLIRAALMALTFVALLVAGARSASAESYTPRITRPVSDLAGAVDGGSIAAIERALQKHHARTQTQIAIVTVSSIDEPIEDFALRTATKWGGGTRELDRGVLVVFAIGQRRSRIEVGYGLESEVTDARARAILDSLRPELVRGDYAAALAKVASALVEATGGEADIALPANRVVQRPSDRRPVEPDVAPRKLHPDLVPGLILFAFLAIFVGIIVYVSPYNANRSTASREGWASVSDSSSRGGSSSATSSFSSSSHFGRSSSSSSFGGSSSSSASSSPRYGGGGGSFGGGGASASW